MANPNILYNLEEVNRYRELIYTNLSHSVNRISDLLQSEETAEVFRQFKFEKTAIEPLSGKSENLMEVINQSQTYFVSLIAAEFLFSKYPDKSFILNWGNTAGYDIEATDGTIIAECFAATSIRSNNKLSKDLKRLAANESVKEKYEFFYALDFTEKSRKYYEKKYAGIHIIQFDYIR